MYLEIVLFQNEEYSDRLTIKPGINVPCRRANDGCNSLVYIENLTLN